MKKFATDIIDSEVLIFQEKIKAGKVEELVISPENGSLLGFILNFTNRKKAVSVNDIRSFGSSFVVINELSSIADIDDIVRIRKAYSFGAKIINEKVETESGESVGKVRNYTINLKTLKLDKIYVRPRLGINFLTTELIIPTENILEIQKQKIIVSDLYNKVKKPVISTSTAPIPD